MKLSDLATLLVTAAVLIFVVVIKYCSGGKIEVGLNDALVATIAAVLMLFVTGRIKKFELGSKGVSVEAAFIAATEKRIESQVQVAALPVEVVRFDAKAATQDIPKWELQEIPALVFVLGSGDYAESAIQQYLEGLTKHSFFRFVIFLSPDGKLFGMIDARKLLLTLRESRAGWSFPRFTDSTNSKAPTDWLRFETLPGFVPAREAVKRETDKRHALERMERLRTEWLPVVEENGQFAGTVEQSRLTTSLILDVANRLRDTAARAESASA
jgi:CBS domain-containing protein